MFIATADKNSLSVTGSELITSGSVKTNFVEFQFSDDWNGLRKTAIFQTKKVSIPIILDDNRLTLPIPWEVMAYAGETINIGVYGERVDDPITPTDEEIVLPTIWTTLSTVKQGVVISNPPTTPPTIDSYLQLLKYINSLIEEGKIGVKINSVPMEDGRGVVVTITGSEGEESFEIYNGVNGTDGSNGVSPTLDISLIDGGHRVTINDVNGENYFDVMNGKNGNVGEVEAIVNQKLDAYSNERSPLTVDEIMNIIGE